MKKEFDLIDLTYCYLAFLGHRPTSHYLLGKPRDDCCKACDLMKLYKVKKEKVE